jgi:hypothetical protein
MYFIETGVCLHCVVVKTIRTSRERERERERERKRERENMN